VGMGVGRHDTSFLYTRLSLTTRCCCLGNAGSHLYS
jgi:hypothetical protein